MQAPCFAEFLLADEFWDMSGQTLSDRMLDVERSLHGLRGWAKGALAVGAVLIAIVGWWIHYELMPAIHGVQSSISAHDQRISTMEGQLKELNLGFLQLRAKDAPVSVVRDITRWQPRDFASAVPVLNAVAKHPAPVLHDVAVTLLELNQNEPSYWLTVLQFIQLASTSLSPDVPPPGPPTLVLSHIRSIGPGAISPTLLSHRIVLLDAGEIVGEKFSHSRIIFTPNTVRLRDVSFEDCVFEMPTVNAPNPYLKHVAQTLLASDLKSVSMTGV